jgi:hypothetical protein
MFGILVLSADQLMRNAAAMLNHALCLADLKMLYCAARVWKPAAKS